jgi:ribosomal-protein-alanine N-acetyltransferase
MCMKLMSVLLETQRARVVKPESSDLDFFKRVYGSPKMMTHLGGAQSAGFIEERLKECLSHWERFGHGYGIVELKETGEQIGIVSLVYETVEGKSRPDLGCMILSEYQQQGLALEVTRAYLEYGFETLKLDFITACHDPTHPASRRLVEELGFSAEGVVQYSYGGKTFQYMSWIKRKGI